MNKTLTIIGAIILILIVAYLDYKLIGAHTLTEYLFICSWEALIAATGVFIGYTYGRTTR